MDKIGPTFFDELAAADLSAMPSWGPDGVHDVSRLTPDDLRKLADVLAHHDPAKRLPPDCPSLAFWLTGLKLWGRYDDVDASIKRLESSDKPGEAALGILARMQFTASPGVTRTNLGTLAPAFGFTPADVDESLWRADRIFQGDLSGRWPVTS
jgi:hypothetical protein